MNTPLSADNKYHTGTSDHESNWDVEKLAHDLPQVFKLKRAKVNGYRVISVRNAPGYKNEGSEKRWSKAYTIAHAIEAVWNNRLEDGMSPELVIVTEAGNIHLNQHIAEYVMTSLAPFIAKGWTITVY